MIEQVAELYISKIQELLDRSYPSRTYNGQLKKAGPFKKSDTGRLKNSFRYEITYDGDTPDGFLIVVDQGVLDYWNVVNKGRRPGRKFPPPQPIRDWIKRKGGAATPINGVIPTLEQRTYLISRSIAKLGIKGIDYISIARKETLNDAIELLGEEYADFLEELIFERTRTITSDQISVESLRL